MAVENIRHKIVERHIMLETLLHNILSNYFCDTEETSLNFLFLVLQKETSFKKKYKLLENLKLYEQKYVSMSSGDYKKGIKSLEWMNDARNNVVHNFGYLDYRKKRFVFNVVKSGNVKPVEINKGFIKELNRFSKNSQGFLTSLSFSLAIHKGLIKKVGKHFPIVSD
jgi:hypothetical protein